MKYSRDDIERIRKELPFHMESIARDLLGQPVNRNQTRELKYGSKGGSLVVTLNSSSPRYGKWHDYQTGEGGDALSLIQKFKRMDFLEAIDYAQSRYLLNRIEPQSSLNKENDVKALWTALSPVPEGVSEPDLENPFLRPLLEGKEVTAKYAYRDEENRLLGYVVRAESDNLDGGRTKETLPLTYCQNQWGNAYWRWKGFEAPRPLYGLEKLKEGKPLLIVEGEKTADAAQVLFPEYSVLTWSGGTKSVEKSDWTPLRGREVTLWPDHDKEGLKAAQEIGSILKTQDSKASVSLVEVPPSFPVKWDLADPLPQGYSLDRVKELMVKAPAWVPLAEAQKIDISQTGKTMEDLSDSLRGYLEPFSETLFGSPVRREDRTLFFGEGGRLTLTRSGVDKGKWWDKQLGKGGDILDLVMHPLSKVKEGIHSVKDKATYLEEWIEIYEKSHPVIKRLGKEQEKAVWIPLPEVPQDASPLFTTDSQGRKVFAESVRSPDYQIMDAYAYHDLANKLLGYRLDVEKTLDDGSLMRSSLPIRWCERQKGGVAEKAWHLAKWEEPRPLFGLEKLAQKPEADVLIVEGEKASLQARRHFPEMVVVTWMMGTSEYKTDWSVLQGRKVFLWPADKHQQSQRGRFLIQQGIQQLHPVPVEFSQGWNFDRPLPSGWTSEKLKALLLQSSQNWSAKLSSLSQSVKKAEEARSLSKAAILDFPLNNKAILENGKENAANMLTLPDIKGVIKNNKTVLEKVHGMMLSSNTLSFSGIPANSNSVVDRGKEATKELSALQDGALSPSFADSSEKESSLQGTLSKEFRSSPPEETSKPGSGEQAIPPSSSPPYGQITAAAALAQLLSFPLVTAAELAQGARKGIRQGIERFIQSREKTSLVHRQSLADFYIRDARLYTRETLDLIHGFQKSPSFSKLHQKIRKEAQEKGVSVESVAHSQEMTQKFSALLQKTPSLKTVALDIVQRLSHGETKWKEAGEALDKAGSDVNKVFGEDFADLHERLKQSLQAIPPIDGKKLQEMARVLIENLKNFFSRLMPLQRETAPGLQL